MKEAKLLPCPFCGGAGELVVRNPKHFGSSGAFVKCERCRAQSAWREITENGKVTDAGIARGCKAAEDAWNARAKEETK